MYVVSIISLDDKVTRIFSNNNTRTQVRVQWRPTNPPRNVLMRATTIDQQNSSTILKSKTRDIRIVMKPNFMGALREKWIRWPSLKRVKRAQRMEAQALKIASTEYKKAQPKKSTKSSWFPGFGKNRNDEDEDAYSTSSTSSNKSKRSDTKRSGEQKDDEIDRKTSESAIELYMACTWFSSAKRENFNHIPQMLRISLHHSLVSLYTRMLRISFV